jgi:hypothetical protein
MIRTQGPILMRVTNCSQDTDEKKSFLHSSSSQTSLQRVRASSTQPSPNESPSPPPPAPELSTPAELCLSNFYEASITPSYAQPTEYSFPQKAEHSFVSFLCSYLSASTNPLTIFVLPRTSIHSFGIAVRSSYGGVSRYQLPRHVQLPPPPAQQQHIAKTPPLSTDTSFTQDWSPPSPSSTSSPSTPQLYSQQPNPSMCHSPLADVEDTFAMAGFGLDPFGQHQHSHPHHHHQCRRHHQHQQISYDHHHVHPLDMDTSVCSSLPSSTSCRNNRRPRRLGLRWIISRSCNWRAKI